MEPKFWRGVRNAIIPSLLLWGLIGFGIHAAFGQSVQQSGSVTPNTAAIWNGTGIIKGGVSATDSPLTTFGVTRNAAPGICVSSDRSTAAGRNQLCLTAGTSSNAQITLQNYGTASAKALEFVINGTTYAFPGSLANITVGTTPVVGGTDSNCLYISSGVVGSQACTLSAITSITGDATATGPGVSALTLATVNSNVGTFGSGAAVPVITVNGKGLITSVTTSPVSLTVGSSVVSGGTTNYILYNNSGVLGNIATAGNAIMITSAGGVPSFSATLPSALTIPSPTFSGTMTLPDAATWTSTGITHVVAISAGSATLPAAGRINVSDQYQVNGSQIAASNLSNGTTGSGSVVLAASPTLSGTVAGSVTLSGNLTLSGNDTFSAQTIHTGTSAPASAAGNTVVMGTIVAPTLSNNGQAFVYNTAVNGAVLQGAGSTYDTMLANKTGGVAIGIGTGTTVPVLPGLAAGTCSSGLAIDSSNNIVKTSCPGAAASIQVGSTTVTGGTTANILFNNAGTLGNETIASILTAGTGISITGTTNATIAASLSTASNSLGADVLLNNTANYFDGPSMAQGTSGTWFASGTVTLSDAANSIFNCKLWDGTTVIDSGATSTQTATGVNTMTLSGILASPAANIKISCKDLSATTGKMLFNNTGNSKDSTVTGFRLG